jgi:hypothetical protein
MQQGDGKEYDTKTIVSKPVSHDIGWFGSDLCSATTGGFSPRATTPRE